MLKKPTDPAAIALLVLDVDGVLTDGRLYYGPRGEVLKVFDVKDGHGLAMLRKCGVEVALISGRDSSAVTRRAKELGIRHVFQGVRDKVSVFERLRRKLALQPLECACVGDDAPDVELMRHVGLSFAVSDAHPAALQAADMITPRAGGRGAVREICDLIIASRTRRSCGADAALADAPGRRAARKRRPRS